MMATESSALLRPKQDLFEADRTCAGSRRLRRAVQILTISIFSLMIWSAITTQIWLWTGHIHKAEDLFLSTLAGDDWSWEVIDPADHLVWHPCYSGLDCARLTVPLDWLEPSNTSQVVLAVVRRNATDLTDYKGPLFMNPGGPGGSAVAMVKNRGEALHTIVGKNHDLIGFDPRGIGATTPQVHCWGGPQDERIWEMNRLGLVDSHPGVLYDLFARQSLANRHCEAKLGNLTRFLGTTSVARDMLAILEQTGYKKLRYMGFSYGTVLGGTFAAMFPDRIDRMVNDGNVNYNEWYNGTGINFIESTDKVMLAFYDLCHLAGPEKCAFYAPAAEDIYFRLEDLYDRLRRTPLQVLPSTGSTDLMAGPFEITEPELISYSDVKTAVIMSLYQPTLFFPELARALAALEEGNGIPFLEMAIGRGYRQGKFSCGCESQNQDLGSCQDQNTWPLKAIGNGDAANFVKCGEGSVSPDHDSLEEVEAYHVKLEKISPLSAPVMLSFRLSCAGWQSRTKWRLTKPFDTNTSYPILFIGNTADNITPLGSAIHDSLSFRDSVVLIQNSFGHTSTSTPSKCTAQHRLAYFQNGTLPANGTFCEADIKPFSDEAMTQDVEEDDEMTKALRSLMRLHI